MVRTRDAPLRIGLLASHEGTLAQAVMDACATGRLIGSVVVLISNNSDSVALARARKAGIRWPTSVARPIPIP